MEYKGLPVFVVDINDASIFNNVSLVDDPAVRETFIKLSKQEELKFSVNDEKRIVSGPALIPDFPIYRDMDGEKFYLKFTEDTVKEYAIKFFRDKREGEGNIQHQFGVNGITFFESYLLNKERGIVPKEFENLPDGTWFLSAKIDNDEVWQLVKDGVLNGFSVDIQTSISPEKDELNSIDDLIKYFKKQ